MVEKEVKEKEEIKKILLNHLNNLSNISNNATIYDDVSLYVISEAMKVTVSTLLFFDKIDNTDLENKLKKSCNKNDEIKIGESFIRSLNTVPEKVECPITLDGKEIATITLYK